MNKNQKATPAVYTTLHQIVQLIPRWTIQKTANEVGVDTRGFLVRSHVVALMLGHLAHASKWRHSISRLAGLVRSALWLKKDLLKTLAHYGTASPPRRPAATAKQMFLLGFEPNTSRLMGW